MDVDGCHVFPFAWGCGHGVVSHGFEICGEGACENHLHVPFVCL